MSVSYVPVQWNAAKWGYDLALVVAVAIYLYLFIEVWPAIAGSQTTRQILLARAFGSCAFLMLSLILMIGPAARLWPRLLPVLYNRRHFGVLTALVALTHVQFVLGWYYAFSPTPRLQGLLTANTSFGQVLGFPFEVFGIAALLILLVLAATSHDFWLSFLGPRLWKRLHLSIYAAYAAVVAHVSLGALLSQTSAAPAAGTLFLALMVGGLHVAAARRDRAPPASGGEWIDVCAPAEIPDGQARIVRFADGTRAAVFRDGDRVGAVSNACAHQNGPLGEGRIVDGCVTCPWHGFQYRLGDGCAPAPFTEKIPTYALRISGGRIQIDPKAKPPGTPVPPVSLSGAER